MDQIFIKELMSEEGTRLYVYDDMTGDPVVPGYRLQGHPTVGVGRALDTHGLTTAEAWFLLNDDLATINVTLSKFDWWTPLSAVRQFVVVSMAFNMGISGVLGFSDMIAALFHGNYPAAADEMLQSQWARQLPLRAHRLSEAMRTGSFPEGNSSGRSV